MTSASRLVSLRCLLAFTLALFALVSTQALAQKNSPRSEDRPPLIPDHVVLDGQDYSRQDLIDAFVEVALSSYIGPNAFPYAPPLPPSKILCSVDNLNASTNYPSSYHLKRISATTEGHLLPDTQLCTTPDEVKQRYPWLYEFVYREHGVPRYFAINKWTSSIRISIGYPEDLTPVLTIHLMEAPAATS